MDEIIYIGMKGSVMALDRKTGDELWRTHLKSSMFVVIVVDRDMVIAHTRGEVFGLDAKSGQLLWQNGLEGMGFGYATIATQNTPQQQAVAAI